MSLKQKVGYISVNIILGYIILANILFNAYLKHQCLITSLKHRVSYISISVTLDYIILANILFNAYLKR